MSVISWHDSDEVDSEDECEAYNMLYYNMEKKHQSENVTTEFVDLTSNLLNESNIEVKDVSTEFVDLTLNLIKDSYIEEDENCSNGIIIISDSDESVIEKKIICTNKVHELLIGSTSDSENSDYNENNVKLDNFDSSSFIFNTNTSFKDKNSNSKNKISNSTKNTDLKTSNDMPDWSVDNIDIQPKSKFRSRYFDSLDSAVCNICFKKGHGTAECNRSGPVCILCGKEGHMSNDCNDIICHICFQTDHLAKKCPNSSNFLRHNCKRCGQRGHNEQICPDIWRQYKYTLAPGTPIVQRCSSQNKHTVFCANCSKIGHFTDQCSRNRMASRFLGPPPIMEIIRYDDIDIYRSCGLKYINTPAPKKHTNQIEKVDSMIMDMDVTGIIEYEDFATQSDPENDLNIEPTNKAVGFGDGFIMLSPIVKPKSSVDRRQSEPPVTRPIIQSSTPASIRDKCNIKVPMKINEELIDSNMPIIPESLLKKLFPEETQNMDKIAPSLRSKLRKKLKKFLKNGYLPGDSQITQDRMEFWLQEKSTGRSLSYKEKRHLLSSVSAALHSISDRVSDVTTGTSVASVPVEVEDLSEDIEVVTSVPESRRKKNKAARQKKNLENELRSLQRDNSRCQSKSLTEQTEARPSRKRRSKPTARITRSKEMKLRSEGPVGT